MWKSISTSLLDQRGADTASLLTHESALCIMLAGIILLFVVIGVFPIYME